jgi:single-stranded-DNA-specific exonuclease
MVVELLNATDASRAREIARELERANETRRTIEKSVLVEAREKAAAALGNGDRQSLVVHGQGWHRGVIGIVAARLVDLHHRPTVVIGLDGETGRGSCRSRPEVDLHRALSACGEHLEKYGGHAMAAGLEIRAGALERFSEAFEQAVRVQAPAGAGGPRALLLDGESAPREWDLQACEALARLAPFGAGNPEPVFRFRAARVAGKPKLLGTTQGHLAFALAREGAPLRVVAFRRPDLYDAACSGEAFDLAVTPVVNEWKGIRSPEMRLVAMRPAHDA